MNGGSSAVRSLYAHLCDTIQGCEPIMEYLDVARGVRRMQMGIEEPWRNLLTYGRATRRRLEPETRNPIYSITVTLEPWIRGEPEAATAGDLILADIDHLLMALFDLQTVPSQTCSTLLVLRSTFDDFQTEPEFDTAKQAWHQAHRFRFDVVVPTCRPKAESCVPPCP